MLCFKDGSSLLRRNYVRIENHLDMTPFSDNDEHGFHFIEERIICDGAPIQESHPGTVITPNAKQYFLTGLNEEQQLAELLICRRKKNPNITNHLLVDNSKCLFECLNIESGSSTTNPPYTSLVNKGVTIRKHPLKNWCVYSNEVISKGQFIAEYVGVVQPIMMIHNSTVALNTFPNNHDYTFILKNIDESADGDTHEICGKYHGNFTSFINHSCNPNLIAFHVLKVEREERKENHPMNTFLIKEDVHMPHVYLFAKRNIEQDEELTLDYGHEYVQHVMNGECFCESKYCRYHQDP
ncbi:hypothetical protein C9374_003755 [Naegleria lovaniensis]|uniref:SET domain-containing protein n=1 Tax=Naegleria lovaniensis TaxID=51637 RepID=A0AA88H5F4_NAELO|nr:uncharacterized protein C9374_003755 [Naegleria lovaniensis]KAG2393991.1 hypothetical protein C9374_003755 [Naegleria lovaniensis]